MQNLVYKQTAEAVQDLKVLQKALDELQGRRINEISVESLIQIQAAENTNSVDWQIQKSNASVEDRVKDMCACYEFTETRRQRLADLNDDEYELLNNSIQHDRVVKYVNFLNRRGTPDIRKQLPNTNQYSSRYDREAVIEAKLMFATHPNLNPKEPILGAKHSMA